VWGFFLIFVPPAPWANVSYTTRNGEPRDGGGNDEKQVGR